MDEGFKEINSRTGKLVDGKFIKDPDAQKNMKQISASVNTKIIDKF